MAAPQYADAEELAALIRDPTKQAGKDYLVVDVRGDDFDGGHIVGAKNVPSTDILHGSPESQVEALQGPKTLYFHCALSQVRGPKYPGQPGQGGEQEIKILRGGFGGWQELYRNDTDLVEDFNAKMWEDFDH
ncbi:Rhodanese-like domain-containing protein [Entophlyctis helioformis]|nr:Rhodanese-like domain-containing protein [Entophlyctis helioformis]